jgi:hypothetical protein
MALSEKPLGMAIVVCDQVITDADNNKKSLIGIFNRLGVEGPGPYLLFKLHVFVMLGCSSGEGLAELVCRHSETGREILRSGLRIKFPNPNHVVQLNFVIKGLVFEETGLYAFELRADDELILESRLNVVSLEEKGD